MNSSYLILGGNLGNRLENLRLAVQRIEQRIGATTKKSSVFVTQAWGKTDQPDFYNQAIGVQTKLDVHQLLAEVLAIELEMGRKREEKWAERIIDIDILFFNADIVREPLLQVPHPHIQERRFVLVPMAEIAADLIHPVFNKNISELLKECPDQLEVKRLTN